MKKFLLLLTLVVALPACAKDNKMVITANLEGLTDGAKVTLVPGGTHQQEEAVAEALVTDGGFTLEYELAEPRLFYIFVENVRGLVSVMAAPGDKIAVNGTFPDPVVRGSEMQRQYDELYTKPRAAMNQLHNDYNQKYADVSRRLTEARRSGDTATVAEIQASDEWTALSQAEGDFFKQVGETVEKIVTDNAGTFWGPLLLMSHTSYLTPDQEKLYNIFSDEAKNSFYGKAVAAELFGITGAAPAFTAKDANGAEHTLAGLLNGNNYVLVDFWASWCGPCRRFVPTVKELAVKYADKGLVVVSISTDTDRDAWLKALEEEQMPWLNLLDESGIGKAYGVSAIPSIYLINPKGELVFSKQNGQSVVDKLKEVFEK